MTGMCITVQDMNLDINPTQDTYDAFQGAYDYFNWTLFESQLPKCLITLQRKGKSYGYFKPDQCCRDDGVFCDEISLNPKYFRTRDIEDVLSTLVHEMTHLWQARFGKAGRGRYHNRQWANKMKSIGLYPSHTGKASGDELGDSMSHYTIAGGVFSRFAGELIDKGFRIEWCDHSVLLPPTNAGPRTPKPSKSGKRVKYTCPACGLNVWSRHDAKVICGFDHSPMVWSA